MYSLYISIVHAFETSFIIGKKNVCFYIYRSLLSAHFKTLISGNKKTFTATVFE